MKSLLLIFACCLHFSVTSSQITIAGKIKMSPSWDKKIYLFSVEKFDVTAKLIDSIPINSDGNIYYRSNEVNPKRILYKLQIPPKGAGYNTMIEGHAENQLFLLLENKDSCFIESDSDAFYYRSRLSGSENTKEPSEIRKYKQPLYELYLSVFKEVKANPTRKEQILQEIQAKWMNLLDTFCEKLTGYIDRTESPGGKLLGLYTLYIAKLGEIDSLYAGTVISATSLKDYYLTEEMRNVITSAENNRLGVVPPDVALYDSNGKAGNLYSMTKSITVIDFWAGFCGPCRKANRNEIRTLVSRFQNTDTTFLAVSVDIEYDLWTKAMREDNVIWPSYTEQINNRFLNKILGISAVPVYIVLNEKRAVIFHSSSIYHLMGFLSGTKN